MTWRRDTRPENVRTFGDFKIFSEVNSDRETAHVVQFPDGREIRVLPDPNHNGRVRAAVVRGAVEAVNDRNGPLEADTAVLVVLGALARAGLKWQELAGEVSIEEWLESWFANDLPDRGPADFMAECLLGALQDDGLEIVRKGEE